MKSYSSASFMLCCVTLEICLIVLAPTIANAIYFEEISIVALVFILLFRLSLLFLLFHLSGYIYFFVNKRSAHGFPCTAGLIAASGPHVAVVIPARNEPLDLIERMIIGISAIDYINYHFWIVDNSDQSQLSAIRRLITFYNAPGTVLQKSDVLGYKAGALNFAISNISEKYKYILILDIDHSPDQDILRRLVPYLENDSRLAFVQAPQHFRRTDISVISKAFNFKQRIFYEHVCPGMSNLGCVFLLGTNFLIRRRSLDDIGGFSENCLTEDLRTTFDLHINNWQGIFINERVALGDAPVGMGAYHRQQRRWAIGTFQNFIVAWRHIRSNRLALDLDKILMYLGWNGAFYFQGIFSLLLLWGSLVFIATDAYALTYWTDAVPFFVLIVVLFQQISWYMRLESVGFLDIIMIKSVLFSNAVIYVKSLFDFLTKKVVPFDVTDKKSELIDNPEAYFLMHNAGYIYFAVIVFVIKYKFVISHIGVCIWAFIFLFYMGLSLITVADSYKRT